MWGKEGEDPMEGRIYGTLPLYFFFILTLPFLDKITYLMSSFISCLNL